MTGDPAAALDAIYAEVPRVACRGLCHDSCTVIDASPLERRRLADVDITVPTPVQRRALLAERAAGGPPIRCSGLTAINTCRAYDRRPTICRLFGVAEGLLCEHGCTPERVVGAHEAVGLLERVQAVSDNATRGGRQ